MISVPSAKVIIAVSVLAMALAIPSRAAEKLSWHPKLVHRQIGGGYTLALESARRDKTFFLCLPGKTDCISTKEIGWRTPFIIIRNGSLIGRSYSVVDTTGMRHSESPNYLKTVLLYPAAVAWEKLSPTRALW
jgi:hypothetical protein